MIEVKTVAVRFALFTHGLALSFRQLAQTHTAYGTMQRTSWNGPLGPTRTDVYGSSDRRYCLLSYKGMTKDHRDGSVLAG